MALYLSKQMLLLVGICGSLTTFSTFANQTLTLSPGKALFNIRVSRFDGGRPRLAKTLGRAYYVWIAGFGLGFFPFNLIAMGFSFFRLLSTGTCLWDKHLHLYVQHAPVGPARILLAVAAFTLLMALQQLVIT